MWIGRNRAVGEVSPNTFYSSKKLRWGKRWRTPPGLAPLTAVSERAVQADRGTASFAPSNKTDSSTDRSFRSGAAWSSKQEVSFFFPRRPRPSLNSRRLQPWQFDKGKAKESSRKMTHLAEFTIRILLWPGQWEMSAIYFRSALPKQAALQWKPFVRSQRAPTALLRSFVTLCLRSPQKTWLVFVGTT